MTWLPVVVLGVAAVLFALAPLGLARLWTMWVAPRKPGSVKQATYECGLESRGDAWVQFRSEYYLYAILFLVFDVEVVFLVPFAVAFLGLPAGACVAFLLFVAFLAEGLVWAWRRGFLRWSG